MKQQTMKRRPARCLEPERPTREEAPILSDLTENLSSQANAAARVELTCFSPHRHKAVITSDHLSPSRVDLLFHRNKLRKQRIKHSKLYIPVTGIVEILRAGQSFAQRLDIFLAF